MKIAIGLGKNKNVLKAIQQVPYDMIIAKSNEELLKYIHDPRIDGCIRGSLESNIILDLKKKYPHLFRASILENKEYKFILTPVGIDECDTIKAKKEIIKECANLLEKTGHKPKIALISSGREQDKGRSAKIDHIMNDCETVTNDLNEKYDIKHYHILIEDAIKDHANIIVAPDGIIGNIIFRSLVLVGELNSHGAITLKQPNLFIDTSRSQSIEGYINSIKLTAQIIEAKKNK